MRSARSALLVALILTVWVVPGRAQALRGKLLVTVADTTGAVIPNAKVSVLGLEETTKAIAIPPAQTSSEGTATIAGVPLGRYTIVAEFVGFDVGYLRDVRVRGGDNKHIVILKIQGFQESVNVGQDTRTAAADRNVSFGSKLSQDEIDALSEDPTEMARQIQDLAGSGATIRIDSFEGVQLPPKAQIKSIHVTRDQFAAETEVPGSIFVDVITQPGVGPIRGQANMSFHDGSMSARNPFTTTKGAEQSRGFGGNIGGAIIPQKSNFSVSLNGSNQYSMPNQYAANRNGSTRSEVVNLRQPSSYVNTSGLVDYAITRDQTFRLGYNQQRYVGSNQGVGGYDELERAYSYYSNSYQVRLQEAGPLGRRTFINSRAVIGGTNYSNRSVTEAPTIIVQDAFNSGGAQVAGGTRTRTFTLASDVDYVRGIHSWRAGAQVAGGWSRSDSNYNYLGTYTFNSLEDFQAGRPAIYTRQVGNPVVAYFNAQTGIYFQDDIRVRKGLTLSPGVRYSAQTHVSDTRAFEPRFGVTWAPTASGSTTLRASGGIFHGWLSTYTYEQTLRIDGTHQRESIVQNPSYPDPGTGGIVPPTNKYILNDYGLQQNVRYSGGIDQTFSPKFRATVLFNYFHQRQLPRGLNLNAPVNGVRPDGTFANVIEVVTDAEIIRHEAYVTANLNLAPGPASLARFNWRKLTLAANYSFIRAERNSGGPFDPPPTGDLEHEWGHGPADNPYRLNLSLNSSQVRNLTVSLSLNASAGQVYNWTTGTDDNHDGIINDRPAGVGILTLRGTPQRTINTRWAYALTPGAPRGLAPGAIRYRMSLFANISNLTNHQNLAGFSGNEKSLFFRKPTMSLNPRRVDVGLNVSF
jgi:hypothetical protein